MFIEINLLSFTEVCAKPQFKKNNKSIVEECLSLFEELSDNSHQKLSLALGPGSTPALRE